MRKIIACCLLALMVIGGVLPAAAASTRIKDIAKIQGVRSNQLTGLGLVVGLTGTGDSNTSNYTMQMIANMLKNAGVSVPAAQLKAKNVAAVSVTARLPAFVKPGDTIDIEVSSIGDAKTLQGGTLLQTPLQAANGAVYAVAQGPLSVGGFVVGSGGSSQAKNFTTVGTIPGGAIVEREVPTKITDNGTIALAINQPDYTTASRITEVITSRFGSIASARDAGTVVIAVPPAYASDLVGFIAAIEDLPVNPDTIAKVIVNERTSTVVMGGNVTIDEVAVAQGSLTVKVSKSTDVSQPPPLSGGSTVVTQNTTVDAKEQPATMIVLPASTSVSDVVSALNAVGATPRDVIAILQAMKAAGALRAELQVI